MSLDGGELGLQVPDLAHERFHGGIRRQVSDSGGHDTIGLNNCECDSKYGEHEPKSHVIINEIYYSLSEFRLLPEMKRWLIAEPKDQDLPSQDL